MVCTLRGLGKMAESRERLARRCNHCPSSSGDVPERQTKLDDKLRKCSGVCSQATSGLAPPWAAESCKVLAWSVGGEQIIDCRKRPGLQQLSFVLSGFQMMCL